MFDTVCDAQSAVPPPPAGPPSSTSMSGPSLPGHVSICSVHHQYLRRRQSAGRAVQSDNTQRDQSLRYTSASCGRLPENSHLRASRRLHLVKPAITDTTCGRTPHCKHAMCEKDCRPAQRGTPRASRPSTRTRKKCQPWRSPPRRGPAWRRCCSSPSAPRAPAEQVSRPATVSRVLTVAVFEVV